MTEAGITELLTGHGFFRSLASADLAVVAACGREVQVGVDQYMLREGEPADRVYALLEGRVALEVHTAGRGRLVVDTVEEGEVLGISWLLPPYRWMFDGRALLDVRAVALDAPGIRQACQSDPRLGYELALRFAEVSRHRLESARLRLLDLYGATGAAAL